jgi:hypothetical protein
MGKPKSREIWESRRTIPIYMVIKGPREAGSREEEVWITVVLRSSASNYLFKSNRKFIRVDAESALASPAVAKSKVRIQTH